MERLTNSDKEIPTLVDNAEYWFYKTIELKLDRWEIAYWYLCNIYANRNISLLSAISYSDNIYAMKTHFFLGLDTLGSISKRVHINTPVLSNASSALGTTEINMLDFANGYITLANEGIHKDPYFIEKITDLEGNILYEHKQEEERNNREIVA